MLYQWYELGHAAVRPARAAADGYRLFFENPFNPMSHTAMGRSAAAACEVFERTTRLYSRPSFGLETTVIGGKHVGVSERFVWEKPYCRLLHFKREVSPEKAACDPRILLVAPMSGHFATLLRGTVEALLPNHEVYITDWRDARNVPQHAGSFDIDDYIIYMREMWEHLAGDVHVVAVCQPSVPVMAAAALMEADDDVNVPSSITLMGGPVDTRISPTAVNKFAEERGTDWFARNVLVRVPMSRAGGGRKVYPGFLQLSGFMSMNLDRHMKAQKDMFIHLVRGDGDSAERHRDFYDEYLAVMDLTADFYMQTIKQVFVEHQLPKGEMMHHDRRVDLGAIKQIALMTVEGEKDDITGIGQCSAALDLCHNIPENKKQHYECPGVGHYGIFNGKRYREQIAPRIADFVRRNDVRGFGTSEDGLEVLREIDFDALYGRKQNGPDQSGPRRIAAPNTDPAANAFTFSTPRLVVAEPANDEAPDPLAQRAKATGIEALGTQSRRSESYMFAAQATFFGLWSMIGSTFFGNLARLHESRVEARPALISVESAEPPVETATSVVAG